MQLARAVVTIALLVLAGAPCRAGDADPAFAAAMNDIHGGRWQSAIDGFSKLLTDVAHDRDNRAAAFFWRGFAYSKLADPTRAWEDVRQAQQLGFADFSSAWRDALRDASEFEKLLRGWRTRWAEFQHYVNAIDEQGDATIASMKRHALAEIAALGARIDEIERRRDLASALEPSESAYHITVQVDIDNAFRQLRKVEGIESYARAVKRTHAEEGARITVVSPVSDVMVLPRDPYVRGEIARELSIAATPGEYEPASFVITATRSIGGLTIVPTDLKSEKFTIPSSSCLDLKFVKCWYQGFEAWYGLRARDNDGNVRKVLVPELLLNDDDLVRVDLDRQEQQIRLLSGDGQARYVSITDPAAQPWTDGQVRDSDQLQPLNLPAGTNKQIWITVKVPDDAPRGRYTSTLQIKSTSGFKSDVKLHVDVLPFKLAPPGYTSSMFYTGSRYAVDLKNLAEHGIANAAIFRYPGMTDAALREVLEVRKNLGLLGQPLYFYERALSLEQAQWTDVEQVKRVVELARSGGASDVYFYGLDEAGGEKLLEQRPYWKAVHDAGGKILAAGGARQGNRELVGDLLDVLVSAYRPRKTDADAWHALGKRIWNYANPQGGVENPEIWRRNYGLLLWRENFDGACTWTDAAGTGNPWNDFDFAAGNYRDQTFVYPSANGVINTIALEGYREGVDDVRYMTTLESAIKSAAGSQQAADAEAFVRRLRGNSQILCDDLTDIRAEIIRHLLALPPAPATR